MFPLKSYLITFPFFNYIIIVVLFGMHLEQKYIYHIKNEFIIF